MQRFLRSLFFARRGSVESLRQDLNKRCVLGFPGEVNFFAEADSGAKLLVG